MAVTHLVTQFTQVSTHFGVYSRKQTKLFWKTLLKIWSRIWETMVYLSTKLLLEKSAKNKKKIN